MEEALKSQVGSQVGRAGWATSGDDVRPESEGQSQGTCNLLGAENISQVRVLVQGSALPLATVGLRAPLSTEGPLHAMVLQTSPLIKKHPPAS